MINLRQLEAELDAEYPEWREWGVSLLDAAVEVGLVDDTALALLETPELRF